MCTQNTLFISWLSFIGWGNPRVIGNRSSGRDRKGGGGTRDCTEFGSRFKENQTELVSEHYHSYTVTLYHNFTITGVAYYHSYTVTHTSDVTQSNVTVTPLHCITISPLYRRRLLSQLHRYPHLRCFHNLTVVVVVVIVLAQPMKMGR